MSGFVLHYEAQRVFRPTPHGMDIVALEVLRELARRPEIEAIHAYCANPVPDSSRWPEKVVWHVLSGGGYPVFEQVLLPAAMKRNLVHGRPNLFHFTSNTAPLLLPSPSVITVHDAIFMGEAPRSPSGHAAAGSRYQRWGRHYRRAVVPRVAARAERVVTVSRAEKENLVRLLGIPAERIAVAHNGIADSFFEPLLRTEVEAALHPHAISTPFVLFLGNTDPKKNTRATIQAFLAASRASATGHRLVLVDVQPSLAREMEQLVPEAERHLLVALPYAGRPLLRALYARADLFLYTSLYESFGLPLLEAMASQVPVIASNRGAIPEVAGGHAAALVDPTNVPAMGEAISRVLLNPPAAEQLQAARDHARRFAWSATADTLCRCYQQVLGGC